MIKVLFDTSVLIAALWVNHEKHSVCITRLQEVHRGEIDGLIATHTLAEVYSVLTRLPIQPRLSPKLTEQLIRSNLQVFHVIPLTFEDYQAVIEQMVSLSFTGGAIYDALIAQAAVKTNVNKLLTLNRQHFTRLGENITQLVECLLV